LRFRQERKRFSRRRTEALETCLCESRFARSRRVLCRWLGTGSVADTDPDTHSDTYPDTYPDPDPYSHPYADTDPNTYSDGDANCDPDANTYAYANTYTYAYANAYTYAYACTNMRPPSYRLQPR
jgi:hypothetical protein